MAQSAESDGVFGAFGAIRSLVFLLLLQDLRRIPRNLTSAASSS